MWYHVWLPETKQSKAPLTFGVLVVNGIVKDAGPILSWSIGKRWDAARSWLELELNAIISEV